MLDRRCFLGAAALGFGAGVLGAAGCTPREQLLRVATNVWPGYELLYLAAAQGYFDETQVRLLGMPSATACLQALASGNAEAAALTLDEVLSARADRMPLTIVALLDFSRGADVVLAQPGIASLAALRGKRIGVEKSAVGAVMLDAALRKAGLSTDDVELVFASVDAHEEVFRERLVDALVTFQPVPNKLGAGAVRLFDSAEIPGRVVDVLAVRQDVLASNPQSLRALVAGHFWALADWRRDPARAAPILARRLELDADEVPDAFVGIELPDVAVNREWLTGSPSRLHESAAALQQIMIEAELLPRPVDMQKLVDERFLP